MKTAVKSIIVLILAALAITGCSSAPEPKKKDPFNDADSQRSRAQQTQGELSRDTAK